MAPLTTVATMEPATRDSIRERTQRLKDAFRDAYDAIRHLLPTAPGDCQLWHTHARLVSHLETQIARLERQLTIALAADGLSDEDRGRIVRGLTGTTRRDAKLLTEPEADLVRWYRQTDKQGKAMLRTLLDRLRATNAPDYAVTPNSTP